MADIFNPDFKDFVNALNSTNVRYVLIGGYSVIIHGYNRTTGDIDLWVEPTEDNFIRLQEAFRIFGLPIYAITKQHFLDTEKFDVFTFGKPPSCIEILTKVKGLEFEETYSSAFDYQDGDFKIRVIHFNHLIQAKEAAGRNQDLNDIEKLKGK